MFRSTRSHITQFLILFAALVLATLPASGVVNVGASTLAQTGPSIVSVASAPTSPLCVGEKAMIHLLVTDASTGVPATEGYMQVYQSAALGGIVPPVVPIAGTASFTYTAQDDSSRGSTWTDNLTFQVNGMMAAGSVPVVINRCEYEIKLQAEDTTTIEEMQVRRTFTASGVAKRNQGSDSSLSGSGDSEGIVTMTLEVDGASCSLAPPSQGSGSFEVSGRVDGAAPNAEVLTLEFDFTTISFGMSNFTCRTAYGNYGGPFPVEDWDPNDMELNPLVITLSSGSGQAPVSAAELTGEIKVTRKLATQ